MVITGEEVIAGGEGRRLEVAVDDWGSQSESSLLRSRLRAVVALRLCHGLQR
jgi:hypothetical protein